MSIDLADAIKVNELTVPSDLGVKDLGGGQLSVPAAHIGRLGSWAGANGLEVKVGDTAADGSLTVSVGAKYSAPSVSSAAARAAQCSF
jgi:hypothetical protein